MNRLKTLEFENVEGLTVPKQPMPQKFYISGQLLHYDAFEIRPLTATGLIKGVGRNFVVLSYWRFMVFLRILGLLNTPEMSRMSWRHLTYRVWEYQMWERLYPARGARCLRRLLKEAS